MRGGVSRRLAAPRSNRWADLPCGARYMAKLRPAGHPFYFLCVPTHPTISRTAGARPWGYPLADTTSLSFTSLEAGRHGGTGRPGCMMVDNPLPLPGNLGRPAPAAIGHATIATAADRRWRNAIGARPAWGGPRVSAHVLGRRWSQGIRRPGTSFKARRLQDTDWNACDRRFHGHRQTPQLSAHEERTTKALVQCEFSARLARRAEFHRGPVFWQVGPRL